MLKIIPFDKNLKVNIIRRERSEGRTKLLLIILIPSKTQHFLLSNVSTYT